VCGDEITELHCTKNLSFIRRLYISNSSFNFCSCFLRKVLFTRAQYLLSCAELVDGCLPNITWTQQEREYDTTHSLKYSDDLMQVVWIWRKCRGYGLNWLVNKRLYETDEYNRTETHEICSVSWRWFQNLVAKKYEISPKQTLCSKTYRVKLSKSRPSSWSSWKT